MAQKIGFKTLDNKTGVKTLKQHIFKNFYNRFNDDLIGFVDEPNGNKSL